MKILYICEKEYKHIGLNFAPVRFFFTKEQHADYCNCKKPIKISMEAITDKPVKRKKKKK